jgi:hypothetical protein
MAAFLNFDKPLVRWVQEALDVGHGELLPAAVGFVLFVLLAVLTYRVASKSETA